LTPAVNPLPNDRACPTCMFDANPYGSSSPWVEVSASYNGYSMQNATLTVNGRDVSLKLGSLTGGDIVKVTALGVYSSYSEASVSFTVGGKSVSNAILVY
jgi:hypothetical protein